MSFIVKSRWRLDGILMMIPYTYNDDIYKCHIKLRWRFKSYNEDFSESHQDRVLEEKTSKIKIQDKSQVPKMYAKARLGIW